MHPAGTMEVVMRSFSRKKKEVAKDVYHPYNKTTTQCVLTI